MTYLQLVQALVSELGLSGGPSNLVSVQGNTILELQNAVRWIHDAALDIDNTWLDWKYLWNQYNTSAVAPVGVGNYQYLPTPTPAPRLWDINRLRFRATAVGGTTWAPTTHYERLKLLQMFEPDNSQPASPEGFTVLPNNQVMFGAPLDQAYDFKGEYWQQPTELVNDTDVHPMPAAQHRIILCRAAVMYGNREDAPEVIAGLEAEFIDRMNKLQSDQLESWDIRSTSTDRGRNRAQEAWDAAGWGFAQVPGSIG